MKRTAVRAGEQERKRAQLLRPPLFLLDAGLLAGGFNLLHHQQFVPSLFIISGKRSA
jgi:hypothetical protein